MTEEVSLSASNDGSQQQMSDKELNFRKQEAAFKAILEKERQERAALESKVQELMSRVSEKEDDVDEPYVDEKRLEKRLVRFEGDFEKRVDQRARQIVEEEKQREWMEKTPDYDEVMKQAEDYATKNPEWARTVLRMPEGFERSRLVYHTIKGVHAQKREEPKASIQDKIDQSRRSPYYQPSGIGTPPYAAAGDFSPTGQKTAYQKMKELQAKLRV